LFTCRLEGLHERRVEAGHVHDLVIGAEIALNQRSYNIQRFGNQTNMQGYNAGTGNSWSQNSMTLGNSTYINGQASDGSSWNENIQHFGNTTTYSGTDSNGNSFNRTCGPLGCY
jgi:hypothetical protein